MSREFNAHGSRTVILDLWPSLCRLLVGGLGVEAHSVNSFSYMPEMCRGIYFQTLKTFSVVAEMKMKNMQNVEKSCWYGRRTADLQGLWWENRKWKRLNMLWWTEWCRMWCDAQVFTGFIWTVCPFLSLFLLSGWPLIGPFDCRR